jgi:DNA-binding transcriptional ArsR family regulator
VLQEIEQALKAAGDATRCRILKVLEAGPLCGCQLVAVLGLSQPTVSSHLAVLRNAGLIQDEKRGKWVFYSVAGGGGRRSARELAEVVLRHLDGDPRVAEDLRRVRSPAVRRLIACCPPPAVEGPGRGGRAANRR